MSKSQIKQDIVSDIKSNKNKTSPYIWMKIYNDNTVEPIMSSRIVYELEKRFLMKQHSVDKLNNLNLNKKERKEKIKALINSLNIKQFKITFLDYDKDNKKLREIVDWSVLFDKEVMLEYFMGKSIIIKASVKSKKSKNGF